MHFWSFFVLVYGTERVTVHPPPMKVWDQVFLLIRPLPILKTWCHQLKVGWTILKSFQNDRHWNLEITFCAITSKAVRVTILMSIDMFLGARNSIMPIKNIFVLWKINKLQVKRISRAFSVIFVCYSMGQIGLMCTLHSMKGWDQVFFAHKTSPNIKSRCHLIQVGWTTYFGHQLKVGWTILRPF